MSLMKLPTIPISAVTHAYVFSNNPQHYRYVKKHIRYTSVSLGLVVSYNTACMGLMIMPETIRIKHGIVISRKQILVVI